MDFESLDPDIRTVALVGSFLQQWSSMESKMNQALAKALGLRGIQQYIVSHNIQFRDKIHMLRACVDISLSFPPNDKEFYKKQLQNIADMSPTRNMIAHDMFFASEKTDGVTFLPVKAKGKVDLPETDWPILRFYGEFTKIAKAYAMLDILATKIERDMLIRATVESASWPPTEALGLLGLGYPQGPHTPESPHSDPPNPRRSVRIPPSPPEE